MVFRAELIEIPVQSLNTIPTAEGAVRPGDVVMVLSAIVGPEYPPAVPP